MLPVDFLLSVAWVEKDGIDILRYKLKWWSIFQIVQNKQTKILGDGSDIEELLEVRPEPLQNSAF